jgi:predicted transcriptional regulator YdeE
MAAYRQGDVVLIPSSLPRTARRLEKPLKVRGETNDHILYGNYQLYRHRHRTYVVVAEESKLEHPQHDTISIPPGTYLVKRVRTYVLDNRVARIINVYRPLID